MIPLLQDHAVWIAIGFPVVMIGLQFFLFAFPGDAGRVTGIPDRAE